ncbi:MAG TPA: replication initiator protein A [Candidatus Dorea intestinavium]|nr:replication initiator protein A [Candidatus Dorea intestinavium]
MADDNKNKGSLTEIERDPFTVDWIDGSNLNGSKLNNVKHPQKDFFIADLFDAEILQLDQKSMEFPLFSLRARDVKERVYTQKGFKVKIAPNPSYGMATIHDKDIWIYCISKLMQAIRDKKDIDRTVHFTIYDYLVTTNRATGGKDYDRAKASLDRLSSTRITTDIETDKIKDSRGFGLIDSWRIVEEKDSRMIRVSVTLPDWLFRSITSTNVLEIHQDYFRIRRPLDRRVYEIAKKHCGYNDNWPFKLETLYERSGSTASLKEFKRSIKELVLSNHLPDYRVELNEKTNDVLFINRSPTLKKPTDLAKYVSVAEFESGKYGGKSASAYETAVAVFKAGKYLSKEVQEKYKIKDAKFMQAKKQAQRELRIEANAQRFDNNTPSEKESDKPETKQDFNEEDFGDLDIILRSYKSEILIDQATNALLRLYENFGVEKVNEMLAKDSNFDLEHLEKLNIFEGVY